MNEKEISSQEAGLLLQHLMKGAIPVLAFFTSGDGVIARLYGFVDSITAEAGLLISATQGMPAMSSMLAVPIGTPAGTGCGFFLAKAPDERLEMKYGDTALIVRPSSGGHLSIFFTAKSVPNAEP
jgi:hypothetical protein